MINKLAKLQDDLKELKALVRIDDFSTVAEVYDNGQAMIDEAFGTLSDVEACQVDAVACRQSLQARQAFLMQTLDEEGHEMLAEYYAAKQELEDIESRERREDKEERSQREQLENLLKLMEAFNLAFKLGYSEDEFMDMGNSEKRSVLVKADEAFNDLRFMTKVVSKTEPDQWSSIADMQGGSVYQQVNRMKDEEDYIEEMSKINSSVVVGKEAERDRNTLILDNMANVKNEITEVISDKARKSMKA